jgi:DNA-binding response OmpR family regulator
VGFIFLVKEISPEVMMTMANVLVVEDEAEILELTRFHLEKAGYHVRSAQRGDEALEILAREKVDLAVLDVMLPEVQGTEICRWIREHEQGQHMPVLFVTAKGEERDELLGFEVGGDDYLRKPFGYKLLLARVAALLKRTAEPGSSHYALGTLKVDFPAHSVRVDGERLALTAREFGVLEALLRSKGRTLSRDALMERCWGDDSMAGPRAVDVVVTRLRSKLGLMERHLRTITGFGYQWDERA